MPKAFVSYSWDSESHKAWVREFATRLRQDGVDVTLDQWHLIPGDQIPEFMEKAVRESDYVLIVCTPRFKERSDTRVGGVGYEGDIITGEVHTEKNHRKFIPILRHNRWVEAAPTWLKGKLFVDLSEVEEYEGQYQDLRLTLLGQRPEAPPIGKSKRKRPSNVTRESRIPISKPKDDFEPIRIIEVIEDDIGVPRMDGSRGSALYEVPFRFSRIPSWEWAEIFLEKWNHPPQWTSMHRPGIARVEADRVILDGTTIEEVSKCHKKTLTLAVGEANRLYQEFKQKLDHEKQQQQDKLDRHRQGVAEATKRIKFDD